MKVFVAGGAGFIGSHLIGRLLGTTSATVTVYDNLSSGRLSHLEPHLENPRLRVVRGEIRELDALAGAMSGHDVVYHLASNPDIARAVREPSIDFWEGTYLTQNVLEAMRTGGVGKIVYASGSGVYGETGFTEVAEDYSPMLPISTYGASKLGCEALICSYCYMFEMNAAAFRFANVVGPHQTHGVGHDFVKNLLNNKSELKILGDGTQSKSYIYVTDVIKAMRLLQKNNPSGFSYFNVATLDYITVKEIADVVIEVMGLSKVAYNFTGGKRGWKGDVPVIRMNSNKIRKLGWKNQYTAKDAIKKSVSSIYEDALAGRFGWTKEGA